MKQQILAITLMLTVAALPAAPQPAKGAAINAGGCKSLSLSSDMDVVLHTGAETTADFSISQEAAAGFAVNISGEKINVEQKPGAKKATVHITVCRLEQLVLGANTVVHIDGLLTTPLELYIDNNAKAYLRTTGLVNAHSTSDAELTVEPLRTNGKTDSVVFY